MNVLYVSPSSLPSRSANSIHVVNMCKAFCQHGADVTLVARRTVESSRDLRSEIEGRYGPLPSELRVASYFLKTERMASLLIALLALTLLPKKRYDVIFSRNIYFAVFLCVLTSRKFFFETHNPEPGFRRRLQRYVIDHPQAQTVVISDALRAILVETGDAADVSRTLVLHDAAPEGIRVLTAEERQRERRELFPEFAPSRLVGYFGHLYRGRGFEVIEGLAKLNPEVTFLVYGGNDKEINDLRTQFGSSNLKIMGHVSHQEALRLMRLMDVLLMPYQKKVYVDAGARMDTSRWMSPMKMFEYLASNVPIISSRISVLEEVLVDNENALLVTPDDVSDWDRALRKVLGDGALERRVSARARSDYEKKYSWKSRVASILRSSH